MKMQELELGGPAAPLELAEQAHEIRNADSELGAAAAGLEPAAGAARGELHAHGEARRLPALFGERGELLELAPLLEHRQHLLAEALGAEHEGEHRRVLDAVAQQEPLVARKRQRRHQLGLGAALETEVVGLAGVEHFFHHLVQLVHLDRVHAAVAVAVAGVGERHVEGLVQAAHARAQHVLEAQQQRPGHAAAARFSRHLHHVDRKRPLREWLHGDVAGGVHMEEAVGPALQRVQRFGILGRPGHSPLIRP
jgi:hypothetical protein